MDGIEAIYSRFSGPIILGNVVTAEAVWWFPAGHRGFDPLAAGSASKNSHLVRADPWSQDGRSQRPGFLASPTSVGFLVSLALFIIHARVAKICCHGTAGGSESCCQRSAKATYRHAMVGNQTDWNWIDRSRTSGRGGRYDPSRLDVDVAVQWRSLRSGRWTWSRHHRVDMRGIGISSPIAAEQSKH